MTTEKKPRRMAREPQASSVEIAGHEANANAVNQKDAAVPKASKKSLLIAMLGDEGGASLAAIVDKTGWLPHTSRAALTGLRKAGHAIERFSVAGETRYRIAAASLPVTAAE